ncbi:MAG: AlpA family phage regulatory protein [Rhodoferax sp.]|nr:AlpA family phage regulatory protein [Rhodoferax sp.]
MTKPTQSTKARKQQIQAAIPEVATTRHTAAIPSFDELPDSAWVRQADLVRDPKHPTRPAPLPFSPATFWRWVREGKFPTPTKLGERITAWRVGDVRAWIAAQSAA